MWVLASASPRRVEMLRGLGLSPIVAPVDLDESWREDESPIDYVRRLAWHKALAARARDRADGAGLVRFWLAADTTVWRSADAPPLGKPDDAAHARRMLRALVEAGTHRVTTAWALLDAHGGEIAHATSGVHMREPYSGAIDDYVSLGEWRDKAGGYAVQGAAQMLIDRVTGSVSSVVGLPLHEVIWALARRGITPTPAA